MILRESSSGNTILVVDDEGRVYSLPKKGIMHWMREKNKSSQERIWYAMRLATEDGFLSDDRFGVSDVYFLDLGEKIEFEEANQMLDGEEMDEALMNKQKNEEQLERRQAHKKDLSDF